VPTDQIRYVPLGIAGYIFLYQMSLYPVFEGMLETMPSIEKCCYLDIFFTLFHPRDETAIKKCGIISKQNQLDIILLYE
jgi:hypothetical protein